MSTRPPAKSLPISAIVMTRDEQPNITKCLGSLRSLSEVFVVDSESTDSTVDIARSMGAIVVPFHWNGQYPKKKQWCLDNLPVSNDWIMFIDADEELTAELIVELEEAVANPLVNGFFIRFKPSFMNTVLEFGVPIYKLCLFRKGFAKFSNYEVLEKHSSLELELHYQPTLEGNAGRMKQPMIHRDYKDLDNYLIRHIRYSDWEIGVRQAGNGALERETQLPSRVLAKRLFNAIPGRPLLAFLYCYVVKGGFLDGRAGFHYAMTRLFYYWVIGLKLSELRRERRTGDQVAAGLGRL